eukprot:1051073-Alexandrium_andersonii.AAC.1
MQGPWARVPRPVQGAFSPLPKLLSALAGAALRRFGSVAHAQQSGTPSPGACARHERSHHSTGGVALAQLVPAALGARCPT